MIKKMKIFFWKCHNNQPGTIAKLVTKVDDYYYCPIAYVKLDILLKYILQPMYSSVGPHFGNALLLGADLSAYLISMMLLI